MKEPTLNEDSLLQLVSSLVEAGEGKLGMEDSLESLGWDSLTNLTFIAKVDELLGTHVDADLLSKAVTIRDLLQFVSK